MQVASNTEERGAAEIVPGLGEAKGDLEAKASEEKEQGSGTPSKGRPKCFKVAAAFPESCQGGGPHILDIVY